MWARGRCDGGRECVRHSWCAMEDSWEWGVEGVLGSAEEGDVEDEACTGWLQIAQRVGSEGGVLSSFSEVDFALGRTMER